MEVFTIRNLTFAYPEQEKHALSDLTLSVQPGEFLVLCGPSGCGKSTLLRQLKTVLAPHGNARQAARAADLSRPRLGKADRTQPLDEP